MLDDDQEAAWKVELDALAETTAGFDTLAFGWAGSSPETAAGGQGAHDLGFALGGFGVGELGVTGEAAASATPTEFTETVERELGVALDGVQQLGSLADEAMSEADSLAEFLTALSEEGERSAASLLRVQTSVGSALDEFQEVLSEDCATATDASLTGAAAAVSEELTSSLDGAMDGLASNADSDIARFIGEATLLGSDLGDDWNSLLSSAATDIRDALTARLREGVSRAVGNGVESLAQDVAEAAITMSVGSQITAALGPALPMLVAAKKAVQAINTFKGFFGL
ncbi:MAG: hypothetical protein KF718_05300 [Polyangiaceae bacterium]|nr:hypothetical protein [Polyangiaceae bacterium]